MECLRFCAGLSSDQHLSSMNWRNECYRAMIVGFDDFSFGPAKKPKQKSEEKKLSS